MQPVLFRTLSLGVAIAAASSSAFAATLDGGAVAAPDEYGAKVAAQILKAGGNAVDAAVATAFTLAVTYPEAGNIGGGGFMTLYMDGKPYFLDYREVAPKAASKTMYLDDKGEVIENLSLVGAKAAGVPGTVMGLWEAHKRFGKLPWSELLTPAIGYAQKGFKVADKQFQYRQDAVALFNGKTNFGDYFGHMKAGEAFLQPDLAKTLERIADKGPDEFYKGHTADLLVAQMQQDKGLITHQDLADYKVKWREPMRVDWQGNTLYTAPLPSSGGIALAQLLGIKENRAADFKGVELNSARYIHLLAEIEKRVFADRADYLGDPDFSKVPVARLTDPAYLKQRAAEVNPTAISPTEKVRPGLEPHQTTHFSIVDADGNAVSNTYTLNWDFGSGVVVKGAGFLLNDEMDDFSAKTGRGQRLRRGRQRRQRHRAGQAHALLDEPEHRHPRRQGQPGGGHSRRLADLHLDLPGAEQHLRLPPAAGEGRGRAARAPPVAAQGHDLLRRLRAARRQGRRGAEGDGLHPGGPGLEHGRYPGHPRRRQGPGDRFRSPRPRRRPGGETLTGRRAADAARA